MDGSFRSPGHQDRHLKLRGRGLRILFEGEQIKPGAVRLRGEDLDKLQ